MQTEKKWAQSVKKGIWLLVIVAVLWLLPGLFSLDRYVRQVEQQATESLGVPVAIADASLRLLPSPRVVANTVAIGSDQEVVVDTLVVIPKIWTLLASQPVLDVAVEGVHLKRAVVSMCQAIWPRLTSQPSTPSPVLVREVRAHALDVRALVGLPLLHLRAEVDDNQLQHVWLATEGEHLTVDIAPGEGAQQVSVQMHEFMLPGTALNVSQGQVHATLLPHALQVSQVQLRLLSGEVSGTADIDWRARTRVKGRFELQNLSMQALTQTAGSAYLSGRMSGRGSVNAEVAQMADLLGQLRVQASLVVKEGVLHGIDLAKIARLLLKQGQRGGETQFDTLRSQLHMQGARAHFRQIEMQSGLIAAEGQVVVMNGKQLQGTLTVAVKETGGVLEVPLEVSGPLNNPTVLPDRAAVVGAAVGTALMPGVGTSLGIKAGSRLRRLFAGDE